MRQLPLDPMCSVRLYVQISMPCRQNLCFWKESSCVGKFSKIPVEVRLTVEGCGRSEGGKFRSRILEGSQWQKFEISVLYAEIAFQERKAFLVVFGCLSIDGCPVFSSTNASLPTTIPVSNNYEIEIHKKRFIFSTHQSSYVLRDTTSIQ
ncbi:hypothetical protein BDR04DRAFT_690888 [Suillus decipiens]|nr:hypothetical protein BDR04DRAFT_690888 [Suillus decipiens]